MEIIYKISVDAAEMSNAFCITWLSPVDGSEDSFIHTFRDINREEMGNRWPLSSYQLMIGEKIFQFLDGDSRLLSRALDQSRRKDQPLHLQLRTCKEVADWPFELLARDGSFLLPQQIHLARCESDWGENRKIQPRNQPLKLLFMACSAIDAEPELDFEKEEETIFKVTDSLPLYMEVEDSGSLEGLRARLLREQYDVIHLSGHAGIDDEGKPFFVMEDETGHGVAVSPEQLWHGALIDNPPILLFLSGCRTGQARDTGAAISFARELVVNYHIPAVLGWGNPVMDEHATFIENSLYHYLSHGRTLLEALRLARYEALQKYPDSKYSAWPLLRLFCCGNPPGYLVKGKVKYSPTQQKMKHLYLADSKVKVLTEGFVGRRREIQDSLNSLKKDLSKVGVLLTGMAGLGKSCLAGKICERFPRHTLIIIHGRFNAITLRRALDDSFTKNNDQKGKKILDKKQKMTDKIAELCSNSFREKKYLILLDDFELNLEGAEMGQPRFLLPEAAELLEVLLYYLLYSEKSTSLIITSRYSFELTGRNMDLVKERLKWIPLTGLLKSEQKKKIQALPNMYHYSKQGLIPRQLFTGHGNPRLMEWLDVLMGNMKAPEVKQLIDAAADKKEEFIRIHVIRELLHWGGEQMTRLLQWSSIYRLPVFKKGIERMGDKTGMISWKKMADKAIVLTLLEYNVTRKSYQVAPLLREKLLDGIDDIISCHRAAFDYYSQLCDPGNTKNKNADPIDVEEWVYHALACGEEEIAVRQGGLLVEYFRNQFAYREARRIGEWILANLKKELNTKEDSFLLNALGYSMNELGCPKKAIAYYSKALAIDRALYGQNHPEIAIDMNNLGTAYEKQGSFRLALRCYWQSLTIDRIVFGEQHVNVALRLINIGSAFYSSKNVNKAIDCFEQALNRLKKIYTENHPMVATVLNNLGTAWKAKRELKKAIYYYYQALEVNRKVHKTEHPDVAASLFNLGRAWKCTGEVKNAVDYFEEAVSIWEKIYEENSFEVVSTYEHLGSVYAALGHKERAEQYTEKVRAIIKKNPDLVEKLAKISE